MRKIDRLKKDATESATWRNHTLGRWHHYKSENRIVAISDCVKCNRTAVINTNPMPNEIDIGGEAVAVNCDK